jgi:hypothetical protein
VSAKRYWLMIARIMEREQLCSEHAAVCWHNLHRQKKAVEVAK